MAPPFFENRILFRHPPRKHKENMEVEINGIITIPEGLNKDVFFDRLIIFLESEDATFGGSYQELNNDPKIRYFLISFAHRVGFGSLTLQSESFPKQDETINTIYQEQKEVENVTILHIFEFYNQDDFDAFNS